MSDHLPYTNAWVFTAIAGTRLTPGRGLTLPEVLDAADFSNRAAISKDEFEHAVRDLMNAGLINIVSGTFVPTDAGRAIWEPVWREYWKEYTKTFRGNVIANAEKRLRGITCVAEKANWSLTGREWDDASAAYRAAIASKLEQIKRARR
jgi:hypothetical protein